MQLAVKAGSVDETDAQQGLAHFLEHMGFNGTKRFKPGELIAALESSGSRLGPHVNAQTGFDDTIYMFQLPTDRPEIVEKGMQALADFAGGMALDPKEIEKERGVVLEEWRGGLGAGSRLRDQQIPVLFFKSKYAERLPIGKPEILKAFPPAELQAFYKKWYRPDRMAVVAVGDMEAAALEALIKREFSPLAKPATPPPDRTYPVPLPPDAQVKMATDPEATQSSVAIVRKRPSRAQDKVGDYRRSLVNSLAYEMLNDRFEEMARNPGRVVWLVFNVMVALLLMEIGVYKALEQTLALYSNVAIAWVGALVADLVINKPLGLRPQHIEFKRAHLYDINPVGVGAMTIATIVSISAFYGLFGPTAKALSAFVALAVAFVTAPLIAWATDGKYYIARKPKRSWQNLESIQCCICEHSFEPEDMASCPAYAGPICSLCCSLDARCHDLCKPHARIGAQVSETLGKLLPEPIYARINSQFGHYLGVFAVSAGLVGLTLGLIYLQTSATIPVEGFSLSDVLWKVFFALTIIIGVVAWLFVLAQQSRRAAEAETRRQTALLIQEIDAHKRTDAELQRAKEVAESANLAKSRYVVGLSHELRSPLNAISGYAQLLEQDSSLNTKPRDQVRVVRRSADHLSGLIDGILDISKIEAGRLYLSRDEVRLSEFLDQLVGMFRVQATAKGIDFVFKRPAVLPLVVYADEKRLRQVLINLLSNALKFTQTGSVQFVVHYRSPVAEFEVIDTGPGIQASDLERIFAPFERGALGVSQPQTGTGLGLTISRLLAGVMGGDIRVTSEVGKGSTFRVKILLSEVTHPTRIAPVEAPIFGYHGPRKTILITDDDPTHRDLLREVLAPLGFILLSAPDGPGCLALAQHCRPDLFLLDISMAGMDGWTVAETLRVSGHHQARILMVSASALEAHGAPLAQPFHDGYLMKPIDIPRLVETIRQLLKIEWQYEAEPILQPRWKPETGSRPPVKYVEELIGLGQLGYIRAIQIKLDEIGNDYPEHADFVSQMRTLVDRFDLDQYMATLKTLHSYDH